MLKIVISLVLTDMAPELLSTWNRNMLYAAHP